jgi:hypothetical protein
MANNSSIELTTSRYVQGGMTEISSSAIEWWERNNYSPDSTDLTYTIESKFSGRPDLISAVFYNEPRYWWLIAQYNNVLDPHEEFITGRILLIPTPARLKTMLNGRVGGIPSQRTLEPSITAIV